MTDQILWNRRTILLVSAFLGFSPLSSPAAPVELNRIKAVVNGEPITQTMVDQAVQMQVQIWLMGNKGMVSRNEAAREIRLIEERALDDLIDKNLILSEFKKRGGAIKDQFVDESIKRFVTDRFKGDQDQFMAELKKTGMTIAQFREVQRDQIAIQALRAQNSGDDKIPNTPWEKKEKYEEIKGEFASEGQPEVSIMSIAKQTETSSPDAQKKVLDQVMSKLKSGGSFAELAKKHSADSHASKGGHVGVLGKGELNEGLTRVAYSLPAGQVSAPLDDGPFWRILKVERRVGQSTPGFEKMKEEVDRRLTVEKRQKNLENWLSKLRRDANVRIYKD